MCTLFVLLIQVMTLLMMAGQCVEALFRYCLDVDHVLPHDSSASVSQRELHRKRVVTLAVSG